LSVYLDASVILPILIEEPASDLVDRFMMELDDDLIVSEFAAAEVASALSRRLTDFDVWRAASTRDLDLQAADARLANIFVRRFDLMLRAPDALHAAVCRREDHLLATLDRRLATAALELGVRVKLLA
jgi:predicted nucleic acid-binding protein